MINYIELNRKVYDEAAREFLEKSFSRQKNSEKIAYEIVQFLNVSASSGKILDIGPGNGNDSRFFCERGYNVTAIEFSSAMATVAQMNAPKAHIIEDDFLQHDFWGETFDGILAIAFIHLFNEQDTLKVLQKIRTLLNPEGVAYISTTQHEFSSIGFDKKHNFKSSSLRLRRRFTLDELRSLLQKTEFVILKEGQDSDNEEKDKIWMHFIVSR